MRITMPKDVGIKKPKGILKKPGAKKLKPDAKPLKEARGGAPGTLAQGAAHGVQKIVKKKGKGIVVKEKETTRKSLEGQEQAKDKKSASGTKSKPPRPNDAGRAWKVGQDPAKGRIMIATRDLQPGEIILEEKPLVAASWHAHRCIECHEPHDSASCKLVQEAYPAEVVSKLSKIEKFLKGLEAIEELDIARRLIKLLNMCRTDDRIETHTRPCTAENMPACLKAIKAIREHKLARAVLPAGMTDEVAGRLLSVLNTNSHELGEWGGSGFFVLACLMEHSCRPNCAFNTAGTDLWVTVVEAVGAGEALSIDYTDSVLEPAAARRAHLQAAYGFDCTCAACLALPDPARAFLCPACAAKLCPRALGLKPSDWRCPACARQLKQKERERFVRLEAALEEEPPESLEEVDEVLEHGVFHKTHFVVLQPLRALGEAAAEDPAALHDGTAEHVAPPPPLSPAASAAEGRGRGQVWRRVVEGAEEVLPAWHAHKAIFWDNLAQVLVATGQAAEAKEAFRRAYELTRVSAGEGTSATEGARALYLSPPGSTAELALSYASVKEQLASMQRFGLQGLAFLADNHAPHP